MLACTTRSVSPTDAGEQLFKAVAPRFEEIETGVAGPVEMGGKPAGIVRISVGEHAATLVLWPALRRVLPNHPDIRVEVVVSSMLIDIAAERIDARARLGGIVSKDMTAVRSGPDLRRAGVEAPDYFAGKSKPRRPEDLPDHARINLRLSTLGGLYA